MKKLLVITALAWLAAMPGHASDYEYFMFSPSNGQNMTVPSDGLKMLFCNGQLVAIPKSGETVTFDLAALASMQFSTEEVTAISSLTADCGVRLAGRQIALTLPAHSKAVIATPSGAVVSVFSAGNTAARFLSRELANGIYIVKTNTTTTKIAVR